MIEPVTTTEAQLDATFAALGDVTRRAILTRLAGGEAALSKLAEPFDMTQTAVTKHVRVLEAAGLVEMRKRGRTRYCRLKAKPLRSATDWLQTYRRFWEDSLAALADKLENRT